jgi:hypothetical protein
MSVEKTTVDAVGVDQKQWYRVGGVAATPDRRADAPCPARTLRAGQDWLFWGSRSAQGRGPDLRGPDLTSTRSSLVYTCGLTGNPN